ncbi:unnamed protein product [Brachionus calyciflorus]|uniref:Cornifelin n=1 Tax=Brachionus calyciflorus TaxID=104777 RepID=A0A813M7Q9_9BILA|nr:unnamed protein product [Brachionus calyciflorus]
MKNHPGHIVATEPTENVWKYENEWSNGFCDCCISPKICCLAFFCLPCFSCYTFKRTDEFLCTPLLVPMALNSFRGKMRTAFRIKGSIFTDCLATTFCPICSLVQMYNELNNQGL